MEQQYFAVVQRYAEGEPKKRGIDKLAEAFGPLVSVSWTVSIRVGEENGRNQAYRISEVTKAITTANRARSERNVMSSRGRGRAARSPAS
jgi:hypothetical protein